MPAFSYGVCRRLFVVTCANLILLGGIAVAAEGLSLSVATDHDYALYEVGEEAAFLVTLEKDGEAVQQGTLSYVVDDFLKVGDAGGYPQGKLPLGDSPARVVVKGTKPGFLRCTVTYKPSEGKTIKAAVGVGFSVLEIQPSLPVPDDFDAYWDEQKRLLAEIPADATETPVDYKDESIECFDVQVPCLGGAPVSGYFAKPKQSKPNSLPAILWVHGAGVRSSSLGNAVKGAKAGMLSMDINAHGIPNGKPDSFYASLSGGELKSYRYEGRDDRDTSYFRGMFLRLVRAIDFLTSQPQWNGRDVIVIGHSQGGGQSLAAGGLDSRVTMIAPGVPAICDHTGVVADRVNGWPKLVPNTENGQPDAKVLEASRYVDAVNFASRCRAEAIMSVGFVDSVCPPSSCYAAYNALQGEKRMINEPHMGHAAPTHIQQAFFDQVLAHVNQSVTASSN
ncbi:acetylxylan esterase [Novipirellula caenicola]|uniref:Acetyl esterase Axe7A n=1 Tax=Novipirellula caenicola TaxID=1536901 RepID=A0ABP9VLF3_9BACT